jgi:hypothetical protein
MEDWQAKGTGLLALRPAVTAGARGNGVLSLRANPAAGNPGTGRNLKYCPLALALSVVAPKVGQA